MTVQYQHIRGVTAPSGAPSSTLANDRRKTPPPSGSPMALLEARLTGSYSALELNDITWSWLDAYDAGLLDVLDVFTLTLKNEADSLINLAGTGIVPSVVGAPAWTRAKGWALTGDSDYIKSGVIPTAAGQRYALASAHAMISISDAAALASGGSVIGSLSPSPAPIYVTPGASAFTAVQGRINATTGGISAAYTGPVTGCWVINRPGASSSRLVREGVVIGSDTSTATTVPRGEIVFGRLNVTDYDFCADAIAVGAGLTPSQEAALATIVADHHTRIRRWA